MFNNEGTVVISAMRDLTVGGFDYLDITSTIYVEKRLSCTQRIIRGAALLKYREVLVTCKHSAKELTDDEWTLDDMSGPSTEEFWDLEKTDTIGYDGNP